MKKQPKTRMRKERATRIREALVPQPVEPKPEGPVVMPSLGGAYVARLFESEGFAAFQIAARELVEKIKSETNVDVALHFDRCLISIEPKRREDA